MESRGCGCRQGFLSPGAGGTRAAGGDGKRAEGKCEGFESGADGIKRNGAEAKEEKVTFLQGWQPPFGFLWGAASRLVLKFEVQPAQNSTS